MRRHIRNYEKPDGWSKGQPEVLVAKNVIKKLGVPVVNYDTLHHFITDVGVPYDDKTTIKLFGRSGNSMVGGWHLPYTRTVHVNAVVAEKRHPFDGGTMRFLAHELRHRSDSTNRKAFTAVEFAARLAVFKTGYEASELMPILSGVPLIGAFAAREAWCLVEPSEMRANAEEKLLATSSHINDILFPNTLRAEGIANANLELGEFTEMPGKAEASGLPGTF